MPDPRHLIVTGAAAGIGLAIARQLASQGFAVGLIDQSAAVEAVAATIAQDTGAPTAWALADLADAQQIPPALATLQAALGPAAGLVNNAGIASHIAPVVRMQAVLWARELAVHLIAPMLLSQALLPGMVAALVGFLCSDVAGYINGAEIDIGGGADLGQIVLDSQREVATRRRLAQQG